METAKNSHEILRVREYTRTEQNQLFDQSISDPFRLSLRPAPRKDKLDDSEEDETPSNPNTHPEDFRIGHYRTSTTDCL